MIELGVLNGSRSRLALILDDLLWVLTDSQLTAALHFLDSLSGLVQQANELSRRMKAARKLEVRLVEVIQFNSKCTSLFSSKFLLVTPSPSRTI